MYAVFSRFGVTRFSLQVQSDESVVHRNFEIWIIKFRDDTTNGSFILFLKSTLLAQIYAGFLNIWSHSFYKSTLSFFEIWPKLAVVIHGAGKWAEELYKFG